MNIYDNYKTINSTSNYICNFECKAFDLEDTIKLQYIDVCLFNSNKIKYDLENNFTFIIPIKVDCNERLSNLETILQFINENFCNYKIIVSEQDNDTKLIDVNYKHLFKVNNGYFHKTKCVNDAVKITHTEFGCMYDSDYVVTPASLFHCFKKLKLGYDFAHPSIGMNIYFNKHHTNLFFKDRKLPLQETIDYHHFFSPAHYPGLCFMFNTKSFYDVGLSNENFITWGFEDHEIFIRIEKLNKKVYYSPSCGYHLWHPRKGDFYQSVKFIDDKIVEYFENQKQIDELIKVFQMSKDELEKYIKTWDWIKN